MNTRSRDRQAASEVLDAVGDRLARRMATLLVSHRRRNGLSRRRLARSTDGRFSARDLRRFELGRVPLSPELAGELATLYRIELETALPPRIPLEIRPFGVMSANGIARSFTPGDDTSLMAAYIDLVRAVRDDDSPRVLDLRRADIDILAEQMSLPGDVVVERLGAMMGATLVQRRTMAGMFLAGAIVISLGGAGSAVEVVADADQSPTASASSPPPKLRSAPRPSPWSSAAMIDRAGHRQLINPVFSWSPPPRSSTAHHGGLLESPSIESNGSDPGETAGPVKA